MEAHKERVMSAVHKAGASNSRPSAVALCGTQSGVTALTAAIVQALIERGLAVQTYTAGLGLPVQQLAHFSPGPLQLGDTAAVLDSWLLSQEQNLATFHRLSAAANVSLLEGSVGAVSTTKARSGRRRSSSSGDSHGGRQGGILQLAQTLGLPVVLVVDAERHSSVQSITELLAGEQKSSEAQCLVADAIIFNRAQSAEAVDELTAGLKMAGVQAAVLGGVLTLDNPSVDALAQQLQQSVDLDQLLQLAGGARVPPLAVPIPSTVRPYRVQIGIAWDEAFGCYFQENLELLGAAGAELVPFSPLRDLLLPPGLSALYLGGSAPEPAIVQRLSANTPMLAAVRAFAGAGGLVLAEGGGLAYLSQALQLPGEAGAGHDMAGVLSFRVRLLPPETHAQGYAEVTVGQRCALLPPGSTIRGRYNSSCVVVEERVVQGLGSALSSSANKPGGTTASSNSGTSSSTRSSTSSISSSISGSITSISSSMGTAYSARTASALATDEPGVAEGYCIGGAVGSLVHLHFGSCPAAAPHMVQRCVRVDVATVTSAAAEASRRAAEAVRAAQAAEAEQLAAAMAERRGRWNGEEGEAWSAGSSPMLSPADSPMPLKPRQGHAATQYPSATRSVPDLVIYEQRHKLSSKAGGLPSPLGSPNSGYQTSPRRHVYQGYSSGQPSPEPQQHNNAYQQWQQQHQGQQGRYGSVNKSMSTNDIQHLAAEAAEAGQQQQQQQGGNKPPPFAVPKRWTLELQRSFTSLFASVNSSANGSTSTTTAAPLQHVPHHRRTHSAGGRGSRGGAAAGPHCRSPVGGTCSCGNPGCCAHDAQLLPLDEQAVRLLDGALRPVGGKAHQKLIGLAVPLVGAPGPGATAGSCSSYGAGRPPVVPSGAGGWGHGAMECTSSAGGNAAGMSQQKALSPQPPHHSASTGMLAGLGSPGRTGGHGRHFSLDFAGRPPVYHQHQQQSQPQQLQLLQQQSQHLPHTASAPALPRSASGPVLMQRPSSRPPDRIISLSPAATDCILAMGLLPRLAGATDACELPPEARQPSSSSGRCAIVCRTRLAIDSGSVLGGSGAAAAAAAARIIAARAAGERTHDVDERALQRERPALVIVPGGSEDDAGVLERRSAQRALERSGVFWPESGTAVLYQSCHTLSEVLEFMLVLGAAADAPEAAAVLVERLRTRLRHIAVCGANAADANGGRRPRVAVIDGVSLQCVSLAGRWVPEMVSLAGGVPVGGPMVGAESARIDWEALRKLAPDVIVLTRRALPADAAALDAAELAAQPGWWGLPAVRSGRVYAFDQALLQRPGPRLVDGVEALAAALRPRVQQAVGGGAAPMQGVLRMMLHGGQRCRPKLLPNYFAAQP